ncbi:chaperone protein dnaJ 8, chloroplastic-like [Salvia splendens]|uniref:chaperone protein dnaJ 8, chloroplastic-like n=1 Tax=Salvia splendens TaxID=180675 RepID=UPI001C27125F|nr:chaperone protein dnaJ 8, chloroplastic-like [Salvia splendens]
MAAALGCASASGYWAQLRDNDLSRKNLGNHNNRKGFRVSCISSAAVFDSYKTLRIQPGASESEVKKAFRQLALQYHPDVCRENNGGNQFHQINEAYDIVMSNLRGEMAAAEAEMYEEEDEEMRGMNDQDWDLWEEWMGWEGAGIRDYSSHINPYI